MSGGVDSSVAALLLTQAGYDVIGVTMRLYSETANEAARLNRSCCSIEDVEDARAVCRTLGIRHYFLNFEREFKRSVIDYFVAEYEKGRTPYPCLACNDRLKFDFLLSRAAALDAELISTGHYARIEMCDGLFQLLRGVDPTKDQAYVLFTLSQAQMGSLLLPVGGYEKSAIREIAAENNLPVADKPDSQDICFIPDGDYRAFVEPRIQAAVPGAIVGPDGGSLGSHDGIHNFTIGQRKGLGVTDGHRRPMYVIAIDAKTGVVTLGNADDLLKRRFFLTGVNWMSDITPEMAVHAAVRIRYRSPEAAAEIRPTVYGAEVEFEEPQRAVTPGQVAVFYDGDEVLGGGTIELEPPAGDESSPTTSSGVVAQGHG